MISMASLLAAKSKGSLIPSKVSLPKWGEPSSKKSLPPFPFVEPPKVAVSMDTTEKQINAVPQTLRSRANQSTKGASRGGNNPEGVDENDFELLRSLATRPELIEKSPEVFPLSRGGPQMGVYFCRSPTKWWFRLLVSLSSQRKATTILRVPLGQLEGVFSSEQYWLKRCAILLQCGLSK